jgi:MoxR-like ATPase
MLDDAIKTNRSITQALDVLGWDHLDAVILASLATEAPLLLVGPHGTAKSLLVERIADALDLSMRHYNASLLNYDDLVGIPMPDEEGTRLSFIQTPGTIWGAGFTFFDEISRCRADLQNKLFPIIHERRLVGIELDDLKHRWAAMNPPAPDDLTSGNAASQYYLGSEPLDAALTDRFPYIVNVPNWADLSKEDRYALVASKAADRGVTGGGAALGLGNMVRDCAAMIPEVEAEFEEWLGDYVVYLMELLDHADLPQSPRRARMLARSICAVHAARRILEGEEAEPEDSAEVALIYGMPQNATEVPPAEVKLVALHKQAWEMTLYLEDDMWRQVMEEFDRARRLVLADGLGFSDEDMSRLVTQTIGSEDSDARQVGLATAMFLAFRDRRNLAPSAWEPIAQLAYHVLEPRTVFASVQNNSNEIKLWNEVKTWIENQTGRENSLLFQLERNFVLNGFPKMWNQYDWKDALQQFRIDLSMFGIDDEEITE